MARDMKVLQFLPSIVVSFEESVSINPCVVVFESGAYKRAETTVRVTIREKLSSRALDLSVKASFSIIFPPGGAPYSGYRIQIGHQPLASHVGERGLGGCNHRVVAYQQ